MADTEYTGFMYAAHRDVLVVENLAKEIDPYTEAIAFHSQQAAEKMVKNVFIQNGIVPSKTHSVDELLSKAIDSGWLSVEPPVIDAAINISMHAVAARYSRCRISTAARPFRPSPIATPSQNRSLKTDTTP